MPITIPRITNAAVEKSVNPPWTSAVVDAAESMVVLWLVCNVDRATPALSHGSAFPTMPGLSTPSPIPRFIARGRGGYVPRSASPPLFVRPCEEPEDVPEDEPGEGCTLHDPHHELYRVVFSHQCFLVRSRLRNPIERPIRELVIAVKNASLKSRLVVIIPSDSENGDIMLFELLHDVDDCERHESEEYYRERGVEERVI